MAPVLPRIGIFGWGVVAPRSPDVETFERNLSSHESWMEPFNGFGPDNFLAPLRLDAAEAETWPDGQFDVVLCINMIHISPWSATVGLMKLAAERLVRPGGLLALYGPYVEADVETAPSNLAFHESLRARDPAWGLRALEDVVSEARLNGLRLTRRDALPANNLGLLFRSV